jgi:hypothetical protein
VDVLISIDPGHLAQIHEVAGALGRAGLRDGQVLDAAGVVTGRVDDPATVDALQQVDGVEAVEESRDIQLPPPDAPVQ